MASIKPDTAATRRGRYATWLMGQAGWPAALGGGLLVFAVAFHVAGLLPAQERLSELRADVAARRAALAREAQGRSGATRAGGFPAENAREDLLQEVHDAAEARGVRIDSAEYRQAREGLLLKSELILPVHGTYPQLRAWLADIMNGIPALALDEFSLHRESVGNPMLEGRVRLSLFLEGRP